MDIEGRLELVRQVGEEIVTVDELRQLLEAKAHPVAYDGFEPSPRMHIAQGLYRAINANKMMEAGCHFKIWIADWFAMMNNKLEGDLERIEACGEYMVEVWKACGMKTENMEFLWSRYVMGDEDYWEKVIRIGKSNTVQRIVRCSQIMGRSEHEQLSAAQIFYPCMQAADIFQLEADICQLGQDQRKVNILAREIGPKLGFWKPVIVSHHMLMGLDKPDTSVIDKVERSIAMKMSRADSKRAIFMADSREEVEMKIAQAYCPPKVIEENPIIEYARYIIFEKTPVIEVRRAEKFGGTVAIEGAEELEGLYLAGKLHPNDLKAAVAECINELLEPVRKHFGSDGRARKILERAECFGLAGRNAAEIKTFKSPMKERKLYGH